MKSFKLWSVCATMTLGAIVLGADRSADRGDSSRAQASVRPGAVDADAFDEGEFSRIAEVLLEDGRLAIAGIVGLRNDVLGRTVIEIKKDGDFNSDMVLTLRVPLITLDSGEVGAGGIDSVKIGKDTVTLTISGPDLCAGTGEGTAAASAYGGCEGVMIGGRFYCVTTTCTDTCTKKIKDGVKYCMCIAAK